MGDKKVAYHFFCQKQGLDLQTGHKLDGHRNSDSYVTGHWQEEADLSTRSIDKQNGYKYRWKSYHLTEQAHFSNSAIPIWAEALKSLLFSVLEMAQQ